jgi:hypothetical protein
VRLYISERSSELSARETLPCRYAQCSQAMGLLRFHRHSKPEAMVAWRLLCFYLADPTDVGFLDAFFPTAGSREASFLGAWMASLSKDVAMRGKRFHRLRMVGMGCNCSMP